MRVVNNVFDRRGSQCSFKRKGASISPSSLVWGKSLTFCTCTRSCACANDAKIVRSRNAQRKGFTLKPFKLATLIDWPQYIKIGPKTTGLTRSLLLRSIVLGWIIIYKNRAIVKLQWATKVVETLTKWRFSVLKHLFYFVLHQVLIFWYPRPPNSMLCGRCSLYCLK